MPKEKPGRPMPSAEPGGVLGSSAAGSSEAALVLYDEARRALAELHRVDEIKSIRDKAVAMQAYAKQAQDTTLITQATEIRLRAERRAGELLIEMAERDERRTQGQGDGKGRSAQHLPKLSDLGINRTQSSRWQRLAALDKDHFEAKVEAASSRAYDVITRRFIKAEEIKEAKGRHAAVIEQSCTVDDLVALAASGQRFGVIYADPPWPFNTWSPSGEGRSAVNHYRTDAVDEIVRLPVAALAADDCVLLLWCTGPHIAIGTHVRIIEAWGFRPSTIVFDWIKQNSHGEGLHTGMGYWSRSNAEPVILATKGSPRRFATDVHQIVMAPVGEHSAKPEEVRRRIERLFAGPYLELYARRSTPGWTCWGNEIPRNALREQAAPSAENDVADQGAASLSPPSSVDDDLSIPDFLHRSHPGETGGAA